MPRTAKALASEIEALWNAAEREDRGLTADERKYMERLVDEAKSQNELEKKIREIGGHGPSFAVMTDPNHSFAGGGPGDVFVKSQGYQRIQDASSRGQTWST